MNVFKKVAWVVIALLLVLLTFKAYPIAKKFYKHYQFEKELTGTILDQEVTVNDIQNFEKLPNGAIVSSIAFEFSEVPPIWEQLSENGSFKDAYKYLDAIDFSLIVYKSDSLLVNAIQAEPKKEDVYPAIIYNRGGNQMFGKNAKGRTLYNLLQVAKLAEKHVVLATCYREQDEFGGNDLNDVLYLIKTAKTLPNVDENRIGMAGWSRGGMMTYLALKHSKEIKAAAVINGPTDLERLIEERPAMETEVCAKLIPDYQSQKEKALQERSVLYWPNELDTNASLLIVCGSKDTSVNPEQAHLINDKLQDINYPVSFHEFDTDHSFTNKNEVIQTTLLNWFTEHL
ncbi:alpha/beta hydrolase family protein [Neptunitalea lumnitzerae]|uniref:Peptidase n=1 Tax=Neptunitalea lumnitzerae TaxID=2965509 RepID=A0ABQ5MJ04_9FLAO|nr:prolyl oligopeptidase family serine peptidase [Neptunitalea sp. Y10]GLB49388.1 peptidase [Neptunitalea sp. Y10]